MSSPSDSSAWRLLQAAPSSPSYQSQIVPKSKPSDITSEFYGVPYCRAAVVRADPPAAKLLLRVLFAEILAARIQLHLVARQVTTLSTVLWKRGVSLKKLRVGLGQDLNASERTGATWIHPQIRLWLQCHGHGKWGCAVEWLVCARGCHRDFARPVPVHRFTGDESCSAVPPRLVSLTRQTPSGRISRPAQ